MEENIIESVLKHCKPEEWETVCYKGAIYHLFDLQPGDEEYFREVQSFYQDCPRQLAVKSLQRVQNPSRLGLFKVRKEQMLFRGEQVQEVR